MNSLALLQALNICIALVERRRLWEAAHESGAANLPNELDRLLELQAVETLAPHASDLLYHLSNEQSEVVQASAVPLSASGANISALLCTDIRCRQQLKCWWRSIFVGVCFIWQPGFPDLAAFTSLNCNRNTHNSTTWDSILAGT